MRDEFIDVRQRPITNPLKNVTKSTNAIKITNKKLH
jgi:hypothetical protein